MTVHEFRTLITTHNIPTTTILHLLDQGIEAQRIKCQINDAVGVINHDDMKMLLQGERLLLILSTSRLT